MFIKKLSILLIVLITGIQFTVKADEGMYLLSLLNKLNLNDKGLLLSPEDIYSINNTSLKDAVVGLGRDNNPFRFFCTGEIVSDKGLFFTNHHCGYGSIQSHSSPEHDYLEDGFWAMNMSEELINKNMVISILVRMEDVTADILPSLNEEMSQDVRDKTVSDLSKVLSDKAIEGTHYGAIVKSVYEGNKYYLFVYETFKDIRLVGAPPSSIGKFGGDTDNWMWPRHTGDFSIFRIYTGPDGKPATYSEDNIPYSPKHFFPISLNGVNENDFSMVMGFPGSTDRYMTSYTIKDKLDIEYPARIKLRGKKLDIMNEYMNMNKKVNIQYASKYARVSNYWKYFIGQSKGLTRLKIYDKKKTYEEELQRWIDSDIKRQKLYGNAIQLIKESVKSTSKTNLSLVYYSEGLRGVEISQLPAAIYYSLYQALIDGDKSKEDINKITTRIKSAGADYFKDYDLSTDKQMMKEIFTIANSDMDHEDLPLIFQMITKKYKGDFGKYADKLFEKSFFASEEKYNAFLDNPSLKTLEKDPAFQLYVSINEKLDELRSKVEADNSKMEKGRRLFLGAMLEKDGSSNLYPDANSTPRFTYGYVGSYRPADAVHYNHFTTIEGIMEKEDPSNPEFIVPERLIDLYKKKDYGQYSDKNGDLTICFTTNNDITGGNSGSPVLNAKGELTGLAFDGNWEAMSGDITFEKDLQKCINVDIRYVLFIIDKYAGAKNLINELKLMKDPLNSKENQPAMTN